MSIFPTRILLATDGSQEAASAAKTAIEIARISESELHLVHVEEYPLHLLADYGSLTYLDADSLQTLLEDADIKARQTLDEQAGQIERAGSAVAVSCLRQGWPDREIVGLAGEMGAGLIAMGRRGVGGMRRALMGSVSDSVIRHAHCPVMVVRGGPAVFPTKILLATDGSEDATLASSTAADLARGTGSELHLVYVGHRPFILYESPGAIALDPDLRGGIGTQDDAEEAHEAKLDEQVQNVREAGGQIAGAHLMLGDADAQIVVLAERLSAGLIVMGSRGLGPLKRALMGSVSDSVVRHAHCPVMVVRSEKERSAEHEADLLT